MVSTVDDMLRWAAHLRGKKRVGSPDTWQQMLAPTRLATGVVSRYGFGMKRTDHRGVEIIHHSGAVTGFNSQLLTVPAHALDVVVLVNSGAPSASALAEEIVDLILGDDALAPKRRETSAGRFAHLFDVRYRTAEGLLLTFGRVGKSLAVGIANMSRLAPLHEEDDTLHLKFETVGQGPYVWRTEALMPGVDGRAPDVVAVEVTGRATTMKRLLPSSDRSIGAVLTGRYRSVDLVAEAEVVLDDGLVLRLRGDFSGWRTFRLTSFGEATYGAIDEASPGDRYALDFDVCDTGVAGFWIDTFRARRIRFDRCAGQR